MTRPYAIAGSALATVIISLLAASITMSALAPEAPKTKHWNSYGSSYGRLYQLSPIPAGADWGLS
jgi:hypothetical protein